MTSAEKQQDSEKEEDVISKLIGDFGRWQLTFTFILSLFNLPCTWQIYSLTFQAPADLDFWCSPPLNLETLPPLLWRNVSHTAPIIKKQLDNPCKIWDVDYEQFTPESILKHDFGQENVGVRDCKAWTYKEEFPEQSLISHWNLVCSDSSLLNTAQMVFLAGVAFGGLISGFFSDRFGRKKTLMVLTLMQLSFGLALAFVPWFSVYLVLRFVLGLISVGIVLTGFVLCMELVGGKWRTISGVCYIFPVSLGYISSAGISYFIRAWNYNQIAISLPSLLFACLYWILPESPRWLLAMGKVEENKEILTDAARMNQKELPQNIDKILQQHSGQSKTDEEESKAGICDLFRYPNIRRKSLVLYVVWFTVYFVYYGIVMNMGNFGGDIFLNTIISGLVEIPSLGFSIVILRKMGRRWPMGLTMVASGVVCLGSTFFDESWETATIGLAMAARCAIACSNMIMPIYTAELFPTVVRNLGVGSSNISGGVAMVLIPFLWQLAVFATWLPMGLLGLIGVVGGLVGLTLPETANQPMINTLEEGEEWGRKVNELKKSKSVEDTMTGNFNKTFTE